MLGPTIKSLLKESIQQLPEDYSRKTGAGAVADLTKKGVKQEELEYSGFTLPEGKVTKQDLISAEAKRADRFTVSESSDYDFVTINKVGEYNPTYKSKVLQFREAGDLERRHPQAFEGWDGSMSESRYTSSHFQETPNYLAHTRIYDETMDGTPTRVLTEIQSDLHQQGRQQGYDTLELPEQDRSRIAQLYEDSKDFGDMDMYTDGRIDEVYGYIEKYLPTYDDDPFEALKILLESGPTGVPKSPFEKTWLRKGIERELVDAVNEGRQQLAIPISGEVKDLQRAPGVQKWYETQVLNTAKKVAKQTGSDFEIKTVGITEDTVSFSSVEDLSKAAMAARNEFGTSQQFFLNSDSLGDMTVRDRLSLANTFDEYEGMSDSRISRALDMLNSNFKPNAVVKGKEGVTYAIIKPKGQFSTTLYASPAAGAMAAYMAYQAGKSDTEVVEELKGMGFEADDMPEVQKQMDFITNALTEGYSIEEVQEFIGGKEVKADVTESRATSPIRGVPSDGYYNGATKTEYTPYNYGTPKSLAYTKLVNDEPMTAKDIVNSLEVLHPTKVSDVFVSIPAHFGDEEKLRQYDYALEQSKKQIVDVAKRDFGVDLVWQPGDVGVVSWYQQTEQGLVDITPGFWDELKRTSGEVAGGMSGAVAGFTLAPPHPIAKAAGAFIGGLVGAVSGSQVDYLREAVKLDQDMEAEAMIYKSFNAAEVAAIGEVVGFGVSKTVGTGWKAVKRAKDAILDGNTEGAYRALKETMFLEDEDIELLVERFKKLNPDVKGNEKQIAIQAVAMTEPGTQNLIKAAGQMDAKATQAAVETVNRRAAEVLESTADLSDPDVAVKFKQDLSNYEADVKEFYGAVKAQAAQQPNGRAISFDYDKLAINPILEDMHKNIQDPTVADKFLRQMQIVKSKSESRDFADLVELRQIVNDFLYNKRIAKQKDVAKLRGVINNIDGAIESNAELVLEKPEEWLSNWREARKQYSKMKQVQSQAFYRMMFDAKGKAKPVQPETVVKGMTKYITAIDGSWEDVMSKLPIEGRKKYEGAVVDALANKYALGLTDGTKVIDFVKLADDLKGIQLTTPEARSMKASLIGLSEVFRNDPAIASIGKSFDKMTVNQGLTSDLLVKAKFELASNTYTRLRGMLPGATGREQDLIKQVAKLLDNPLDSKASKELAEELNSSVNLSEQLKELQRREALARAQGKQSGKVKVYSNGKLKGSGPYTTIPMHRIADMDTVKTIADAESITTHSESLEAILKQRGFLGMVSGTDRVKLLK